MPAAPGVAVTVADVPGGEYKESPKDRFLVDFYFSYDIRGLTAAEPNAAVPAKRLTSKECGDSKYALDFAVGRRLKLVDGVSAPSGSAASVASREGVAKAVFERLQPTDACVVVDIAQLCQPLMTFPWIGSVAKAKDFFKHKVNKWEASEWLVCPKLV